MKFVALLAVALMTTVSAYGCGAPEGSEERTAISEQAIADEGTCPDTYSIVAYACEGAEICSCSFGLLTAPSCAELLEDMDCVRIGRVGIGDSCAAASAVAGSPPACSAGCSSLGVEPYGNPTAKDGCCWAQNVRDCAATPTRGNSKLLQ